MRAAADGRRGAADGRRHRHRHRAGRPGAAVRALPPRRRRALAHATRAPGIGLALVAELAELHGGGASRDQRAAARARRFTVAIPFGADAPARRAGRPRPTATVGRALSPRASWPRRCAGWSPRTAPRTRPGSRRRARGCSSSTTTPTCATTSPRCWPGEYAVETAPDGAVALELARARPARPRLTDVMMPNLDGFGLLAALQADPATTGVPVIMVSARAGEEGTIEGLEAGRRRLPDQAVRGARAARARARQPRARPRPAHARPLRRSQATARPGAAARAGRQLGDRPRDRRDQRRPTSSCARCCG